MRTQFYSPRELPEGLAGLNDLALDLRWDGNPETARVWSLLDPTAWERSRNAYLLLQEISNERLEAASKDPAFLEALQSVLKSREQSENGARWFGETHPGTPLKAVAYFSMEFGLSESLPIYAGGLGILAGDHLKTAGDMGIPLFGIGLFYGQGYFHQSISPEGWQVEAYPYNDPSDLPVTPARLPGGEWLRFPIDLPGRQIVVRVWQAKVGNVPLYLLDTNDPGNAPWDRAITSTLYGGAKEVRLIQEIILGIGGWEALMRLGIEPDVCHLNEGHAAFVSLARIGRAMKKFGLDFYHARMATRPGNVFTTHTPVPAGFDRFDIDTVAQYLQPLASAIGVPAMEFQRLGWEPDTNLFNMALLATRTSGYVNGVSQLHGEVSREIFRNLYPHWPTAEIPVTHVTNAIHVASWQSQDSQALWQKSGSSPAGMTDDPVSLSPDKVSDADLWAFRSKSRQNLIDYVRARLERQVRGQGAQEGGVREAQGILDPGILTLGFARRFATYKRADLLLRDWERLKRILLSADRPVQLIIAGKAHPGDDPGKRLIQHWMRVASHSDIQQRVVFLADYDIALAQQLVAGVDVWINTPRRPMEASGTSGMKVLVNGGLNLSELDGWWPEAYSPEVGWALGDKQEHSEADWDAREAEQLYQILEREVVPDFYDRNANGIPVRWLARVRASMTKLTPRFSTERMLKEYTDKLYVPAAEHYHRRIADGAQLTSALYDWRSRLDKSWSNLRFRNVQVHQETKGYTFDIEIAAEGLQPDDYAVQLYAENPDGQPPTIVDARPVPSGGQAGLGRLYHAETPGGRSSSDYTARIVPNHPEAFIPGEAEQILWAR
jgi:starch phosphorylase